MIDSRVYDEAYFMRGKQSGKSLYTDYRWLPDLTVPMARTIVEHCGIVKGQQVLDFGCARGYTVRALRELGHDACGVDVSEWAIASADEDTRKHLLLITDGPLPESCYDWIIAKDVLEHVQPITEVIDSLMWAARVGLFVVVPLSMFTGDTYVVKEYEEDVTHVHRLSLTSWVQMFLRPGWVVEARYRLRGVKDNYSQYDKGNGFITARRIGD